MRITIKSRPAHGLTISLLASFAAAVLGCSGVSAEQTAAPSSSDPVPTPTITAEITAPVVTAQLTSQPSTATPTVLAATATVESAGATANPTQDTVTIQPPAPTATPTATSTPDQPRPAPTATPATTATPTPTPPPTPTPIPGFARQTQFVPLDNPVFVSAEQAPARVTDESFVLGIEWKGEARAYPLDMMWWHHIVNDTIGGDPVLVTY